MYRLWGSVLFSFVRKSRLLVLRIVDLVGRGRGDYSRVFTVIESGF